MSAVLDRPEGGLVPIAASARREALVEVSMVTSHDLSTALHVALAALDACGRGDVVRGHKLLTSAVDRIKGTLGKLEAYGGRRKETPLVRLVDVHPMVIETLRARRAPARVDVQLDVSVAEASVAVPQSVLTLTLVALADAVSSSARSSTVHIKELTGSVDPTDGDALRISCEGAPSLAGSWQIEWAAKELEPWGGRVWGPIQAGDASVPFYAASFPRASTP